MFEIIVIAIFAWLFFGSLGLVFRLTWGIAKFFISLLLFVIALPLLIVCLLFAGGVVLMCPLLVVFAAFWILKKIVA